MTAYKPILFILLVTLAIAVYYFKSDSSTGQEDPELVDIVNKVKQDPSTVNLENLNLKIRAIWTTKCFSCHSSEKMKGELALDYYEGVMDGGEDGPILIKGKASRSEIIRRIKLPQGHHDAMPAKGEPLTPFQIKAIALWIDKGAIWSTQKTKLFYEAPLSLVKPTLPKSKSFSNPVDILVDDYFRKNKIKWPELIADGNFIRKVFLDVTGLLPTPDEVIIFNNDKSPDKREKIVHQLLSRNEAYTLHWLSYWNDLLRNDYSGPGFITEGRKQITSWLYHSLKNDSTYISMVKDLIHPNPGSEGFIKGIAWRGEVNSSQRTEMQAAQNVSQSLLGINLKCASCHNSFVNNITLEQSYGFASIFSTKPLEMHRCDAPIGKFAQPAFISPELGVITADSLNDRLAQLANLITQPSNGRLYRTIVNRIWHCFFGRGIIGPLDDMDQKAWDQNLLDYLAADFRDKGTSIKNLIALMLTSKTYQLAPVDYGPSSRMNQPGFIFKGPAYRKIHAEQMADAISQVIEPMYEGAAFDPNNMNVPAYWIWHHTLKYDRTVLPEPGKVYLRKSFTLPIDQKIESAKLIATADYKFTAYLNGHEILHGTDIRKFTTTDISVYLQAGKNIVAIEAENDGFMANPAGVLVHARIISDRQDTINIYSDDSWLSTDSIANASWNQIVFNDGSWKKAYRYASFNKSPWGKFVRFNIDGSQQYLMRASQVKADPFQLAMGRPTRENVTTRRNEEPGLLQSITLTNHPLMHQRIAEGALRWSEKYRSDTDELIRRLYLSLLCRLPDSKELATMNNFLKMADNKTGVEDLIWGILVSPEFQFI